MADNLFRQATDRQLMDSIQDAYLSANSTESMKDWPLVEEKRNNREVIPEPSESNAIDILVALENSVNLLIDVVFYDGIPYHVARIFSDSWPAGLHDERFNDPAYLPGGGG